MDGWMDGWTDGWMDADAPIVSGLTLAVTNSIAWSPSPGIGTLPLTEVTLIPFLILRR
jgi:hypothetical protein